MSIAKLAQLKPDEKVIAIYRHYGWTYAGTVIIAFILLVIPFFFLILLFSWGLGGAIGFVGLLVVALWYALRLARRWYYNVCIVTDRRIIDVDQRGFFDRVVSSVSHAQVQDVSYRVRGLWATLFHVGTVILETAPGAPKLQFHRLKYPERAVDLLQEMRASASEATPDPKVKTLEARLKQLPPADLERLLKLIDRQGKDAALRSFFSDSK